MEEEKRGEEMREYEMVIQDNNKQKRRDDKHVANKSRYNTFGNTNSI